MKVAHLRRHRQLALLRALLQALLQALLRAPVRAPVLAPKRLQESHRSAALLAEAEADVEMRWGQRLGAENRRLF